VQERKHERDWTAKKYQKKNQLAIHQLLLDVFLVVPGAGGKNHKERTQQQREGRGGRRKREKWTREKRKERTSKEIF